MEKMYEIMKNEKKTTKGRERMIKKFGLKNFGEQFGLGIKEVTNK